MKPLNKCLNTKEKVMSNKSETTNQEQVLVPRTDFFSSDGAYAMHIEVPGVSADAIELDAGERTLTLKASSTELGVRFHRTFRVPRDASMDAVDATLEHGLLRVHVSRQPRAVGKRIEIMST